MELDSGIEVQNGGAEDSTQVTVGYTEVLQDMQTQLELQTAMLEGYSERSVVMQSNFESFCGSVSVLVAFAVFSFCWSCMRQWRRNVLKMGE